MSYPLQSGPRPRIKNLSVYNYRSIGNEGISIAFPARSPLVLIGENNAGKSNILRALSLVLGETWTGNYIPEDHECFGRSPDGVTIRIRVELEGVWCPKGSNSTVESITWKYSKDDNQPCEYTVQTSGCPHTFMTNDVKSQLACMLIGTERDLSYQLSYASKWTYLSKLMRRFHARLIEDDDRVQKLKTFYADLVETFYEVPEFQDFAMSLKESSSRFGGNLPYGLDFDFSAYDASNFFRSLRLFPHVDGESRSFEELGTGQAQILAIAFSYAYARAFGGSGLVLAIEEPESHLHPLAQEWVAIKLRELAASGTQVVLTTHSPNFIDLSKPGTAVVVRKEGEGRATSVIQLRPNVLIRKLVETGVPADRLDERKVGPFYESSATNNIKAGMFARGCVLVEGATEALSLPELLRRVGCDMARLGVAMVPVEGVTNVAKWLRFFDAHEYRVYPIFDTDSNKTGRDGQKAREAREDIFLALGFQPQFDWNFYVDGPIGIHETFAVLDHNYETSLRSAFGPVYEHLEEQAREQFGTSKPLIGRHVAQHLPIASEDPTTVRGWNLVKSLALRISGLVEVEQGSEIPF